MRHVWVKDDGDTDVSLSLHQQVLLHIEQCRLCRQFLADLAAVSVGGRPRETVSTPLMWQAHGPPFSDTMLCQPPAILARSTVGGTGWLICARLRLPPKCNHDRQPSLTDLCHCRGSYRTTPPSPTELRPQATRGFHRLRQIDAEKVDLLRGRHGSNCYSWSPVVSFQAIVRKIYVSDSVLGVGNSFPLYLIPAPPPRHPPPLPHDARRLL